MNESHYAIVPAKKVTYDQLRAAGATMDTVRKSNNGKYVVMKFSHQNHVPFLGLKWISKSKAQRLMASRRWSKKPLLETVISFFRGMFT